MSSKHVRSTVDHDATTSLFDSLLDRREALKLAGAGAAVAAVGLAAPATLVGNLASAAKVREFHAAWPYTAPPQGHFNVFASDGLSILGPGSIYYDMLHMPFAKYEWATGQYVPYMATSWKLTPPATITINLRKGAKWNDGTDFTAQDVLTTFSILHLQSANIWNYLDKVTAVDAYTVNFHMKTPASVALRYVLEQQIVPDSTYAKVGRQVEALVKAGKGAASPEWKALRLQLDQYRPPTMVVTGPFLFDPMTQITNAQLTLVKNPMSWIANQVKFDKIVDFNGETPIITSVVLQKQVDFATQGFPVATTLQFVKEGISIQRPPVHSGPALYINYKKVPALNDKRVRQAIAYAVDRTQNGTVALGQSGKPMVYMSGMSDSLAKFWLTPATLTKLNQYSYNQAKAASILTGLGIKKGSDGIYVAPDGSKMDYTLEVPAEFADWSASAQNLAEQLTSFGIKVTVKAVTYTQVSPDVNHGNFELAIQGWGAGNPFPQFSYFNDIEVHNPPVAEGPGTGLSLMQGGVNLVDVVTASGAGLDTAAQKAAISKMALIFNDLLPIIPMFERFGDCAVLKNVRVAGWPADSDPLMAQNDLYGDSAVVMMILSGKLYGV